MKETPTKAPVQGADAVKEAYEKPFIERVDLALDETMSAGCKLSGVCDDEFDFISGPGS